MIDRSVRSMINDRDYEGADVGDHRPYPRTVYAIHYPGRQKRKKKKERKIQRGEGGGAGNLSMTQAGRRRPIAVALIARMH